MTPRQLRWSIWGARVGELLEWLACVAMLLALRAFAHWWAWPIILTHLFYVARAIRKLVAVPAELRALFAPPIAPITEAMLEEMRASHYAAVAQKTSLPVEEVRRVFEAGYAVATEHPPVLPP